MNTDIISEELLEKAIDKGFKCKSYETITIYDIMKWLRKTRGIHITICVCQYGWFYDVIHITTGNSLVEDYEDDMLQSYEECVLASIEYVLNNII